MPIWQAPTNLVLFKRFFNLLVTCKQADISADLRTVTVTVTVLTVKGDLTHIQVNHLQQFLFRPQYFKRLGAFQNRNVSKTTFSIADFIKAQMQTRRDKIFPMITYNPHFQFHPIQFHSLSVPNDGLHVHTYPKSRLSACRHFTLCTVAPRPASAVTTSTSTLRV